MGSHSLINLPSPLSLPLLLLLSKEASQILVRCSQEEARLEKASESQATLYHIEVILCFSFTERQNLSILRALPRVPPPDFNV